MTQDPKAAKINSCIHQALQLLQHLRCLLSKLHPDDVKKLDEEHKRFAAGLVYLLWRAMDDVETALKRAALDGVAVAASSAAVAKYRELVQPHSTEIGSILIALAGIEPDLSALPPAERDTPVLNILQSGLDFWSQDADQDDGAFSSEDLRRADRLLYSEFFQPDRWLRNSESLQPVVGDKADDRLNTPLRLRLKELYHSFIRDNHFATLALARSILEYALIERAGNLGFDRCGSDGKIKRLSWLIEEAGAIRPELKALMEVVQAEGNKAMHPGKHKTNVSSLPGALRHAALGSLKAVRAIVEDLYLR